MFTQILNVGFLEAGKRSRLDRNRTLRAMEAESAAVIQAVAERRLKQVEAAQQRGLTPR